MNRLMVGTAATLLATAAAVLFWQGHADSRASLPDAPASSTPANARLFAAAAIPELPGAPAASQKTREQKRVFRADKDRDGKITEQELLTPRRKAFAKLDADNNGQLAFNEWANKTIGKFEGADDDHDGKLTAAEYAETAPKRKAHTRCSC